MDDYVFDKTKSRGETLNRMSNYTDQSTEKALQKRKLSLQKTTVSYDTEIKADQFESEGTGIKMSFQATEQV